MDGVGPRDGVSWRVPLEFFFPVEVRRAGVYPPTVGRTLQRYLRVRSFGTMLLSLPSVKTSTSCKGI